MYRPLDDKLTIKQSNIEGLGLFSKTHIKKNTILGISHIRTYIDGKELLIRTPLGGFYNHSLNPNCIKVKHKNFFILKTIKDLTPNEELTVKYTLYIP